MSLTGNIIDVDKIQLTDTFQTWFEKTNELIDAVNPINIYDLDAGSGTNVTYGLSGTEYNGVKSVNVDAGFGVAVGAGTTFPWSGVVSLSIPSISGNSYTLTGNEDYTLTGAAARASEVNVDDYYVIQDASDTTQSGQGTTKRVKAKHMLPRDVYIPTMNFWGDLIVKGNFNAVGAASTSVGNLSVNSQYLYLATTGSTTGGAYSTDVALNQAGIIVAMTGGAPIKSLLWNYNSGNVYWAFGSTYGANDPDYSLVNAKFISRNFVSGDTSNNNTFTFEAAGSTSTRIWLTEAGSNPYFGIVKTSASSNVNFNVYRGTGITSVAHFIAGATSVYPGVTAQVFIQNANVDMLDGAHAVTGASAWTIPVGDALGQMHPDRHNAGQIRRRFTQTNHGLTTGEAVTVVPTGYASAGSLTSANAGSVLFEAVGVVDRVMSANEVSVTMKGFIQLSANGLKGVGASAVTGQYYILDWVNSGGLTTNMSVPTSKVYQPVFLALTPTSGIVYGNEGDTVFATTTDQVYIKSLVPIGSVQSYAGNVAGLTMSLSGGSLSVSDVSYNENWLPCDGRAISATGASGFVDLFQLLGYTYSVRGTVTSSNGQAGFVIRSDRDMRNLSTLVLGTGTTRIVQRSGASAGTQLNLAYTSFTADSSTVTIMGTGLTTQVGQIASGTVVDILTPKTDNLFFVPDLRGRVPFGEFSSLGLRGENINLGITGATGVTASFQGGLYTNYIIRARRESDALILTGHNHDSRYIRKDVSDSVTPGISTTLANTIVSGSLNAASSLVVTGGASITGGLTAHGGARVFNGLLVQSGGASVTGGFTANGTVVFTSPNTNTSPVTIVAASLTATSGIGALKIDSPEPDIYLNDTDGPGAFTTITIANNGSDRVGFGKNITSDFYAAVRDPAVLGGTWRDDAFVIGTSTGVGRFGYGLGVSGAVNIANGLSVTGGINATGGQTVFGTSQFANGLSVTGGINVTGGFRLGNFALSNIFPLPTGTSNYTSGIGNGVNNTVYPIGRVLAIYPGANIAVTLPTTGTWFYYVHATGNLSGTSNTSELPYAGVAAGGTVITPTPNSLHGNTSTWAGFIIRLY